MLLKLCVTHLCTVHFGKSGSVVCCIGCTAGCQVAKVVA